MKEKPFRALSFLAALAVLGLASGCGGGAGVSGGGGGGSSTPPPLLTITTASILPGALIGQPYTTTLVASGGQGTLSWSIGPISPTTLFVTGLSISSSTGVLAGTVNFQGTGGFTAQVTDAASHVATASFSITASPPLQAATPPTFNLREYLTGLPPLEGNTAVTGGVQPLNFILTSSCLPSGMRMDNASGEISGSAVAMGTFLCGLTVTDSFSPPESVTTQFTIVVNPPPLTVANSLPRQFLLNRPFSGRVIATGGIPPYHFSIGSGSPPAGLSTVDPSGGQISGTPTTLGSYNFSVNVLDSSSPAQTASLLFAGNVVNPLGRNDTVATATSIGNGQVTASISPYQDPPDNAPLPADNDYYKLVSIGGSVVHVETQAQRWYATTLDTVIEIVDSGNTRYNTCRQPGDTSANFASICVNDDIPGNPPSADSALDFQVPGAANVASTFYVHVLDWNGQARPDMQYALQISGVVPPLTIQTAQLPAAARGFSYSEQLTAVNGTGNITWSITSGSAPPGLSVTAGAIAGTPTTDGTYAFTLQATDSANPPQTATAPESILVGEPVKIITSPNLPDGCLNQPYTFVFQSTGGIPPLRWALDGYLIGINLDPSTTSSANATFTGVPTQTGTFTDTLGLSDASVHGDGQTITYTINQCP